MTKKHGQEAHIAQINGNGSENLVRYSDAELEEFRLIILPKLDKARKELVFLKEAIFGNPHGTDDTSRKMLKDGNSNEVNDKQAVRQEKFIEDLEMALIRIENKSYGICRITKKLISKTRLRIVPHVTMEVEVKNIQRVEEKKQKVASNQPWLKH